MRLIGGRFQTTQPTLSDQQQGEAMLDSLSRVRVALALDSSATSPASTPGDNIAVVASYRVVAQAHLYNPATAAFERQRTPTIFKFVSGITATGNTALWTPATGKKFRLMGYTIYLSDKAIAAAAADLAITFQDATSAIGAGMVSYVPTAITAGEINPTSGPITLENGYLSSAANNVLNVNLSFALTGGSVAVSAFGTEE